MSTKNQHVDEIHTKMAYKQQQDEIEKYKLLQLKEDAEFVKAVFTYIEKEIRQNQKTGQRQENENYSGIAR